MIKALALLRVSTTQQSVERQKQELEAFTSSKGFKPNEVHYLYKEELERFMKEHSSLLPPLTCSWLELSGFFK